MDTLYISLLFPFIYVRLIRERSDDPEIGDSSFRKRITPKLNFKAKTLKTLISWENVLDEPVLTTEIPTGKLIESRFGV